MREWASLRDAYGPAGYVAALHLAAAIIASNGGPEDAAVVRQRYTQAAVSLRRFQLPALSRVLRGSAGVRLTAFRLRMAGGLEGEPEQGELGEGVDQVERVVAERLIRVEGEDWER